MCTVQCAMYNVQYAVCSVQCAMCSVQCAMYSDRFWLTFQCAAREKGDAAAARIRLTLLNTHLSLDTLLGHFRERKVNLKITLLN